MTSPPLKRSAPGRGITGAAKLRLLQVYPRPVLAQPCFASWQREAARLFREFWRTGNEKHLSAFYVHVVAMRSYERRMS
jgi:hypothetical protein